MNSSKRAAKKNLEFRRSKAKKRYEYIYKWCSNEPLDKESTYDFTLEKIYHTMISLRNKPVKIKKFLDNFK